MIKRALISVSNKTGLVEFAKGLFELGVEILSTGGTARTLQEAGIKVTPVSDVTGFPEILDGRVKTLHPKIHGGLLAVRNNSKHMEQISELGIEPIDLVVINLYPFKQTIERPGVTLEEAIENIDIGGPSMLRSAAKNHKDVIVVVDPEDYSLVLNELKENGSLDEQQKMKLACKVFEHTAHYDALIADFLNKQMSIEAVDTSKSDEFPANLTLAYEKIQVLRYGENPHQNAAFYGEIGRHPVRWPVQNSLMARHYPLITSMMLMPPLRQSWNLTCRRQWE